MSEAKTECSWRPVARAHIGKGYGIMIDLQPDNGKPLLWSIMHNLRSCESIVVTILDKN